MSRIGKLPVNLPAGVSVELLDGNVVKVKGPLGEMCQKVDSDITVTIEDNQIKFTRPTDLPRHRSMHGLYRALVHNMVVGVSEGFSTTQELVDYCKAHPDEKITFGVPGVGSSGQMGIEIYLDQLGIRDNMKFIIYTSGGESLTGHLGKECVIHGGFASDGMRYVETGDLKVLAVSGQTRVAALPNTECFGELGFKTDYMTYQGIWATKGTPEEVINKIADIFKAACATPEWQQYCDEQGCINVYAGPQ